MSKFADKLQHVYRNSVPAIGFRKSAVGVKAAPLLIVAKLTKSSVKEADIIASSIDAGIMTCESLYDNSFKQMIKAMGDVPIGLVLEVASQSENAALVDSGCDFVFFDLKMPVMAVSEKGIGKILEIGPSLDQGLVRAINELQLSVDGVLVLGEESVVTVEHLLVYQRFADLLDKPLLVASRSSVTSSELISLHEAGVNGLVLPEGTPVETFAELRRTVDSLPRTAKRGARGTA